MNIEARGPHRTKRIDNSSVETGVTFHRWEGTCWNLKALTTFHSSHLPSIKNQTCKCARAISILAKSSMKSVWRISEKRGAREGCANYESNRWRGNGEEVERGRGFIMQSRWLRLQLCFLSSRHRPRENSLVDFAALDTALTTLPTEDTFDEPSRKLIMQGGRDRYPSPRRWLKGTSASCG